MKKHVARLLSCVLVLGMLCTVAMAAEVTQGNSTYQFSNEVMESGTFTETGSGDVYPLYIVPIGTKITISDGSPMDVNTYQDMDGSLYFMSSEFFEVSEYTVTDTEVVQVGVNPGYMGPAKDPICVQGRDAGTQPAAPADTTTPAPTSEMVTLTPSRGEAKMYSTVAIENAQGVAQKLDMKNMGIMEGTVYYVPENAKVSVNIDNSYGSNMGVGMRMYAPVDYGYTFTNNILMKDGTWEDSNTFLFSNANVTKSGEISFTVPTSPYLMQLSIGGVTDMGVSGDTFYIMVGSPDNTATTPAPTAPADTTPAPAPTTPAGEATTAETVPVGPGTYTVVKYDTLGHIALNYYGSYKYHAALYNANAEAFKATGGALKPGMVLNLPDTLGTAKRIGMPVAGDGETLYTVKAGDTLGAIAKATYGDVMKYQDIFARNSDRLTNANTIYEGQVIVLPAK